MIQERLDSVRGRITSAAGRRREGAGPVTLVSVTKGVPVERVEEAIALGIKDVGENRVREAELKYASIGAKASWHFIGHLQTNKAKDAVRLFSLIHSADSEALVAAIDREAGRLSKIQDVLVEVNISGEKNKYGIPPEKAVDFIKKASLYPNIHISGLMGMAPMVDSPELARPYFKNLKRIFDDVKSGGIAGVDMRHLSMGMSQDFEVAIEEGSDMVRIGSAIFKD